MKKLVIYHAYCVDGSAAAVAHRIAFERPTRDKDFPVNALDKIDYIPMGHGVLESHEAFFKVMAKYQDITFLDFCPTFPLLKELLEQGRSITIFDHHKDNYEMIEKHFAELESQRLSVIFSKDNKLSGATLTWLFGLSGYGIKEPCKLREVHIHDHHFLTNVNIGFIKEQTLTHKDPLYNLIGIRDTWDESSPAMKERADNLHAYLNRYNIRDFDELYKFVKNDTFTHNSATINHYGELINYTNKKNCTDALDDSYQTVIPTAEGPIHLAIGICPFGQASQFGQSWREMHPGEKTISAALFFSFKKRSMVVSWRSSNIDALRLAQSFPGGGGHANACGCRMSDTYIPYEQQHDTPAKFLEWVIEEIEERINNVYGKYGEDSRRPNQETVDAINSEPEPKVYNSAKELFNDL